MPNKQVKLKELSNLDLLELLNLEYNTISNSKRNIREMNIELSSRFAEEEKNAEVDKKKTTKTPKNKTN